MKRFAIFAFIICCMGSLSSFSISPHPQWYLERLEVAGAESQEIMNTCWDFENKRFPGRKATVICTSCMRTTSYAHVLLALFYKVLSGLACEASDLKICVAPLVVMKTVYQVGAVEEIDEFMQRQAREFAIKCDDCKAAAVIPCGGDKQRGQRHWLGACAPAAMEYQYGPWGYSVLAI